MATFVADQSHLLEPIAFQRELDRRGLFGSGDGVSVAAAQKNGNLFEGFPRMINSKSRTGQVLVAAPHEHANYEISFLHELRGGERRSLCAAGKTSARDRPPFRFG